MANYQCFKSKARDVYCSSSKVKNHDAGAKWVEQALAHFKLKASDILGKPYEAEKIPKGANTYP